MIDKEEIGKNYSRRGRRRTAAGNGITAAGTRKTKAGYGQSRVRGAKRKNEKEGFGCSLPSQGGSWRKIRPGSESQSRRSEKRESIEQKEGGKLVERGGGRPYPSSARPEDRLGNERLRGGELEKLPRAPGRETDDQKGDVQRKRKGAYRKNGCAAAWKGVMPGPLESERTGRRSHQIREKRERSHRRSPWSKS